MQTFTKGQRQDGYIDFPRLLRFYLHRIMLFPLLRSFEFTKSIFQSLQHHLRSLINPLYQIFCKLQLIFTPSGFYQGPQNESPNIRAIAARAEQHSSPLPRVSGHVPLHLSRHPARKWCASERSLASHFVGVWMCRAPPRSLAVESQRCNGANPLRGPQGLSAERLRRIAGGPARRPAID